MRYEIKFLFSNLSFSLTLWSIIFPFHKRNVFKIVVIKTSLRIIGTMEYVKQRANLELFLLLYAHKSRTQVKTILHCQRRIRVNLYLKQWVVHLDIYSWRVLHFHHTRCIVLHSQNQQNVYQLLFWNISLKLYENKYK